MSTTRGRSGRVACGFSLVELLVVLFIIILVISLVVPALGGARNVAKMSTTQSVMKELGNAIDRFRQDNDRNPGVFPAYEMGSRDNADRFGFTGMENVILDLAGGVVTKGNGGIGSINRGKQFGPSTQARQDNQTLGRSVQEDLIGADVQGNPSYYQPDPKFFVAQTRGPTAQQWFGATTDAMEANIPDVVDAFGQPILLWAENEAGPDEITQIEDFARIDTSGGTARFYWASNAGFLKSKALGDRERDQTTSNTRAYSLLGDGVSDADLRVTMTGLLGNPAFPVRTDLDALSGAQALDLLPASSRGSLVSQSAGIDGYYLSIKDRGAKKIDAKTNGMRYGAAFFTSGGSRLVEDNVPVTIDPFEAFDDARQAYGK